MPSFRLLLSTGDSVRPISLRGTRWVMGRDYDCDITLVDPHVSRRHALLYLENHELWVRDLGAKNAIQVNGVEVRDSVRLRRGDRLLVGTSVAEVQGTDLMKVTVVSGAGDLDDRSTVVLDDEKPLTGDAVLSSLNSLANALAPARVPEDAAHMALDLMAASLSAGRGFIARLGPRDSLRILAAQEPQDSGRTLKVSRTLISRLRQEGKPMWFLRRDVRPVKAEVVAEGAATEAEPEARATNEGVLVLPLATRGLLSGLVYLERNPQGPPCTHRDLELASSLARILSSRLEILDLLERLMQENVDLRESERSLPRFLGVSEACRTLREEADALVHRVCPVTILGERGVGKEMLARHIHGLLPPVHPGQVRPFVVLEAKPASGISPVDELFGSGERGVLRRGKLVAAHGGTLCLRNIDGLPLAIQDQLVAALTSTKLEKDGQSTPLEVRLMATSTASAEELLSGNMLTPTLASQLGSVVLEIPPLRARPDDIPLLAAHFLEEFVREKGSRSKRLSPRALDRLRSSPWPGNLAELKQLLGTAAVLARGHTIYPKQIPIKRRPYESDTEARSTDLPSLAEVEKRHILRVLDAVGGNKVMAAKLLGIANSTLYEKMKRYHE